MSSPAANGGQTTALDGFKNAEESNILGLPGDDSKESEGLPKKKNQRD